MSLTMRCSEADCLSRILLPQAPRQATVSLIFDVRQKKTVQNLPLTAYWIDGPCPKGPIGFGVTAFSIEDAIQIIESAGYVLPPDRTVLRYREVTSVDDVPYRFVRERSGPIVVRGVWAPFSRVGI